MTSADRLAQALCDVEPERDAASTLAWLVRLGLDRIPLPGAGATLARWQALAAVAEHDLSLAKLFEGHTDALAILAELGAPQNPGTGAVWATWAAEAPESRARIDSVDAHGDIVLGGAKSWCSGAASASDALLTAWWPDGRGPQLVHLPLRQPGVTVHIGGWCAVGMAGSASLEVTFDRAQARLVGEPGRYLSRAGFWQGGAGVAACWFGGTRLIADAVRRAAAANATSAAPATSFRLAALGKIDLAMRSTAALLHDAAAWIDAHPDDDASEVALRVRLAADDTARRVLDEATRSLGATPLCRDARFARMAADLPVFVRQSHGERDFAALGERARAFAATPGVSAWSL